MRRVVTLVIIVGVGLSFVRVWAETPVLREEGKAPFTCTLVPKDAYTIQDHTMTISFQGNQSRFTFEQVELEAPRKPVNQDRSMQYQLMTDDHDSTFSGTLFLSDDAALYNCYGGFGTLGRSLE